MPKRNFEEHISNFEVSTASADSPALLGTMNIYNNIIMLCSHIHIQDTHL